MALLQDVQTMLELQNLPSEIAFPNRRMPRLLTPAIMLRFAQRTLSPFCLGNLLGEKNTEPFFALELSEEVICEIYSPYLSGGDACEELTNSVLFCVARMPSQYAKCTVTRKQTYYDPDTDCFRASVVVSVVSWLKTPDV